VGIRHQGPGQRRLKGKAKGNWTQRAQHFLRQLEHLARRAAPYQWLLEEEEPSRSILSLDDSEFLEFRAVLHAAWQDLPELMWQLWRATGRPPFEDFADARVGLINSLSANVKGYRKFIKENAHLSELELQKRGLLRSVELLKTRYWSSAECHFFTCIDSEIAYSNSNPFFVAEPLPLDKRQETYRIFLSWVTNHLPHLRWDHRMQRFTRLGGGKVDVSELVQAMTKARLDEETWRQYSKKRGKTSGRQHGRRGGLQQPDVRRKDCDTRQKECLRQQGTVAH